MLSDCADEGDWCYMDNLSGIKSNCCKEGLVCDKMNMKNGYAHCIKKGIKSSNPDKFHFLLRHY